MFVDQAIINVKAGHGGPGRSSFRREKFEPKGGPDGGDGGHGGDIILVADEGLNTLIDFRGRPDWSADSGEPGGAKQCFGGDGQHCRIKLPPGTLVYDAKTGDLLVDLAPKQEFVICVGGKGGFGNEHYKSSTNQAPAYAHPGFPGEAKQLRLELKLLADVGVVGKPNAGKSTLLGALTRANPKIANYPFTTLSPQLGVAELDPQRRLVMADIPGLIEGASEGAGLGHDFLRHIERTRILVHLLDVMPEDGSDPAENYKMIREELYAYSPTLAERYEVIVLNKLDLLPESEREAAVKQLRVKLKLGRDAEVIGISAAGKLNTRTLLEHLWKMLKGVGHTWSDLSGEGEPAKNAPPLAAEERAAPRAKASVAKAATVKSSGKTASPTSVKASKTAAPPSAKNKAKSAGSAAAQAKATSRASTASKGTKVGKVAKAAKKVAKRASKSAAASKPGKTAKLAKSSGKPSTKASMKPPTKAKTKTKAVAKATAKRGGR